MCSTTIGAGSKGLCVNNGRQTKGSTNRKFPLANLFQVRKPASGCIANKSIRTRMTKSASGDEIKCLIGTKETMEMEMAAVTTAQSKAGDMTGLSIKLYPKYTQKRAPSHSLLLSLHFSPLPHASL